MQDKDELGQQMKKKRRMIFKILKLWKGCRIFDVTVFTCQIKDEYIWMNSGSLIKKKQVRLYRRVIRLFWRKLMKISDAISY